MKVETALNLFNCEDPVGIAEQLALMDSNRKKRKQLDDAEREGQKQLSQRLEKGKFKKQPKVPFNATNIHELNELSLLPFEKNAAEQFEQTVNQSLRGRARKDRKNNKYAVAPNKLKDKPSLEDMVLSKLSA